jgi:hypothetical protein
MFFCITTIKPMQKILLALLLLAASGGFGKDIGFGTNQPQTIIDINGDLALRGTSFVLTNEIINAVDILTIII